MADADRKAEGPRTNDSFIASLEAARSGSSEAVGTLLDNCRNYLLLVANGSVRDELRTRVAASDLVQETFLEAAKIFGRFTGSSEEELLWWLTRILENKVGNAVKRHIQSAKRDASREVRVSDAGYCGTMEDLMDAAALSPSSVVAADEEGVRIQAAVLQLPDDYRRIIDLRVHQALSFEDAGRAMNRTAEAARKLFVRAINDLRVRMKADDQPADRR